MCRWMRHSSVDKNSKKITNKQSLPKPSVDEDWFGFAGALRLECDSDYISCRILSFTEPQATIPTIYVKMIDVIEKALKFFITIKRHSNTALTEARNEFGHNVSKLRESAATFEPIFDDPDIRQVTSPFNDKAGNLLQHLRYGSGKTQSSPHQVNLNQVLPVVDKVFFNSILLLPQNEFDMFLGGSLIKTLFTDSFAHLYKNRDLVLASLRKDNEYIDVFVGRCHQYDEKIQKMIQNAPKPPSNQSS